MRLFARAQHAAGIAQVDHQDRNAEAVVVAPVLTHEREIFFRQGGQTDQFAFILGESDALRGLHRDRQQECDQLTITQTAGIAGRG